MWKTLLAGASLAALFSFSAAQAAEKIVYLAGYGGSFEKTLKEQVLPAWEAKTGAKVVYAPGNSTDTLAKLRAQEGAQDLDVAFIDDGPMTQAIQFGFCDKIDEAVFDGVYDNARLLDDKAVGVGFIATGLAYNKQVFEENGWDAPASWNDLADPKFKGKISVPPITNGYGLHALIMMARLNGGGENDIEPGFKAFEDQIDQNVLRPAIEIFLADPIDFPLRLAGLGLRDLDAGDHAHVVLDPRLAEQRARGLEALLRHVQALFGRHEPPVGVLGAPDRVHQLAAEVLPLGFVEDLRGLHLRPRLIPEEVAHQR